MYLGLNRQLVRFTYYFPVRVYNVDSVNITIKSMLKWLSCSDQIFIKSWNYNLFTIGAGILRKNNRCFLFHTSEDIIYIADDYRNFKYDDKEVNLLEKVFFKYLKLYPDATIVNMSSTEISNLLVEPVLPKFTSFDQIRKFNSDLIEEVINTRFNQ